MKRFFRKIPVRVSRAAMLAEGIILLLLARTALLLVPFRLISRWLDQSFDRTNPGDVRRTAVQKNARWAINRASGILPGAWTCFPKALAAYLFCRNRAVRTVLYFGGSVFTDRLESHVWLKDGGVDILGCEISHDYRVLATFPAESNTSCVCVGGEK